MMFLKETMPRKDFEAYCRNINVMRGVANRPSSPKYISPEMFGYKKEPFGSVSTGFGASSFPEFEGLTRATRALAIGFGLPGAC